MRAAKRIQINLQLTRYAHFFELENIIPQVHDIVHALKLSSGKYTCMCKTKDSHLSECNCCACVLCKLSIYTSITRSTNNVFLRCVCVANDASVLGIRGGNTH